MKFESLQFPSAEKLQKVVALQQNLTLPTDLSDNLQKWEESGFLMSGYTEDEIKSFLTPYGLLSCALSDDKSQICSYILSLSKEGFFYRYGDIKLFFDNNDIAQRFKNAPVNYLSQMATDPEWQGQGVSTRLYEFYESQLTESMVMALVLREPVTNQKSKDFFTKQGFKTQGESRAENYRGFDQVVCDLMIKILDKRI